MRPIEWHSALLCSLVLLPSLAAAQPTLLDSVTGTTLGGHFGFSVDLGIDGGVTRAVVGADNADVVIYRVESGRLVEEDRIPPVPGENFGSPVSLDGSRLFVGAPGADGSGAVYYYLRDGSGNWNFVQRFTETVRRGSCLGCGNGSLASVGTVVAVSAPYWDRWSLDNGRVFLFLRGAGGTYSQAAELRAGPHARGECLFGYGLAFDGARLAAVDPCSERVFVWDITTTSTTVTASAPRTYDRAAYLGGAPSFGDGLAFAGPELFVGARRATVAGIGGAGVLLLLSEPGGTLLLTHTPPAPVLNGYYTEPLDVDGEWAAAGSTAAGYAHPLHRAPDGTWEALAAVSGSLSNRFGCDVAVSGDYLMVGEWAYDLPSTDAGRAHLYRLRLGPGNHCATGAECGSGHCVDGVCCNTACSGLCLSCAGSSTGGADGTCGPVLATTDPDSECVDSVCAAGTCSGAGTCLPAAACDAGTTDAPSPIDAPMPIDAGSIDAGTLDGGRDAPGPLDAGGGDALLPALDAPVAGDAPSVDVGARDADAARDAATQPRPSLDACSCRASATSGRGALPWLVLVAALALLRRRISPRVALALALLAPLASTPALAQEPPEIVEAREHYRLATDHYLHGRYAEAAAEFRRSYELSDRPALLHNIYLSLRDLGDLPGAIDALRRYLLEASDVPETDRLMLRNRLAAMERTVGERAASETGASETGEVPGDTASAASDAGAPHGDTEPPGEARPAAPPGSDQLMIGIVVSAAAAAPAIAIAVSAGFMVGERDALYGMCTAGPAGDQCPGSLDVSPWVQRFEVDRAVMWTSVALTAATLGLGLALVASAPAEAPPVAVAGACTADGCVASAVGRF
jgi:hypothetical protein